MMLESLLTKENDVRESYSIHKLDICLVQATSIPIIIALISKNKAD